MMVLVGSQQWDDLFEPQHIREEWARERRKCLHEEERERQQRFCKRNHGTLESGCGCKCWP
jgi:hypothetical protein